MTDLLTKRCKMFDRVFHQRPRCSISVLITLSFGCYRMNSGNYRGKTYVISKTFLDQREEFGLSDVRQEAHKGAPFFSLSPAPPPSLYDTLHPPKRPPTTHPSTISRTNLRNEAFRPFCPTHANIRRLIKLHIMDAQTASSTLSKPSAPIGILRSGLLSHGVWPRRCQER